MQFLLMHILKHLSYARCLALGGGYFLLIKNPQSSGKGKQSKTYKNVYSGWSKYKVSHAIGSFNT